MSAPVQQCMVHNWQRVAMVGPDKTTYLQGAKAQNARW